MSGKKVGSLFQNSLDKSPEMADRLQEMVRGEETQTRRQVAEQNQRGKTPPQSKGVAPSPLKRKGKSDRLDDGIMKTRSITLGIRKNKIPDKTKRHLNRGKSRIAHSSTVQSKRKVDKHLDQKSDLDTRFFDNVPENAHQFGLKDGSTKLDIVVGVDFGTSSTKVVVHAPRYVASPAFAVPFGNLAHESLKYLLPTRVFVGTDDRCSLTPVSDASVLTDIKLGLMRAPQSEIKPASGPSCGASATEVATAYLALVMRYVRCWFIENKRNVFGGFSLNWSCNLGLPAAIDDNVILRETFNRVGKAAWILSRRPGQVTIGAAKMAINDFEKSRFKAEDMPWEFQLVPEVIAEVTGYAKSKFRSEGLHILVDIGASTLDVCSFIVHKKDGDDDFPILTADVGLFGSKGLHVARVDGAKSAVISHAAGLVDEGDPGKQGSGRCRELCTVRPRNCQWSRQRRRGLQGRVQKLLYRTLSDLRKQRDPYSSRWSEAFPVFVCGGATAMQAYQEVVASVGEWLQEHIGSSDGARLVCLPKPESLEADISNPLYHRLAVAWGLSHESFNIGSYSRPSEIDDIPPRTVRRMDDAYISKDMV